MISQCVGSTVQDAKPVRLLPSCFQHVVDMVDEQHERCICHPVWFTVFCPVKTISCATPQTTASITSEADCNQGLGVSNEVALLILRHSRAVKVPATLDGDAKLIAQPVDIEFYVATCLGDLFRRALLLQGTVATPVRQAHGAEEPVEPTSRDRRHLSTSCRCNHHGTPSDPLLALSSDEERRASATF